MPGPTKPQSADTATAPAADKITASEAAPVTLAEQEITNYERAHANHTYVHAPASDE